MQDGRFSWNDEKYESNIDKHGITFEEASTVFDDDNALYSDDESHSTINEQRFKVIGMSNAPKILMVCHCYRNGDEVIRIISARKATKKEELKYRRGY